jgi:hypothetical protein
MKTSQKDMETMGQFLNDFNKNLKKEIDLVLAYTIEALVGEYRKAKVEVGDVIISVETGKMFGNIEIRNVSILEEERVMCYEKGSYVYMSIESDVKRILWTDFEETEPFNRQGAFYVPNRFSDMTLVKTTEDYREYIYERKEHGRIHFGVWGFTYNDLWKNLKFGLCLKKEQEEEFISKLKELLNK